MAPTVKRKNKESKTTKKNKINKASKKVKKPKNDGSYLWIYGDPTFDKDAYEFHPAVQEHIDRCWSRGKKKCSIIVFAIEWTLDFGSMTMSKRYSSTKKQIKRIPKSSAKTFKNLIGIAGGLYRRTGGFQQTENLCNICLYVPTIPTRIDTCGHVFCFVCLKSNYNLGLECPSCRGRISRHLVSDPVIRCDLDLHTVCPDEYTKDCGSMFTISEDGKGTKSTEPLRRSDRSTRTKYYWIYQAKQAGWYRYDPKNEKYLEECFLRKKNRCTLFICGHNMTINLKDLIQERITDGEVHRRRIKRIRAIDVKKYRVRGIAGIDTFAYPVLTN
uniref:E3 ubiquitin-protein ligase n=1 Tax=Caenorhabditis tropicalis TaxID=1561998 RepID=A0A1I7T787_9PELO